MEPSLECRELTLEAMAALSADDRRHLLGGQLLGGQLLAADCVATFPGVLLQRLTMPRLVPDAAYAEGMAELWFSRSPCQSGDADGVFYRHDGDVLYGVVTLAEADFAATGAGADATPLCRTSDHVYRRIFALLDRLGYPQLWRTWNYLADINGEDHGLERYRQFNIGRHLAFAASGRLTSGNVPAACALGIPDVLHVAPYSVSIAFMAGRRPAQAVENPRQIAAYDYPVAYGPRSPTFARASLARLPGQELLFVSGTASILGHASVHCGDVVAQTQETLANIAAVVDEANRLSPPQAAAPWRLGDLIYRAYLRHAPDLASVGATLRQRLGANARIIFVQADVCRADLLVEVEAFASRRVHPTGD